MEPQDDQNLRRFKDHYSIYKQCYVTAGSIKNGQLEFLNVEPIRQAVVFKNAYEIGPNDEDMGFIRPEDDVVIPDGIKSPPINELFKRISDSR